MERKPQRWLIIYSLKNSSSKMGKILPFPFFLPHGFNSFCNIYTVWLLFSQLVCVSFRSFRRLGRWHLGLWHGLQSFNPDVPQDILLNFPSVRSVSFLSPNGLCGFYSLYLQKVHGTVRLWKDAEQEQCDRGNKEWVFISLWGGDRIAEKPNEYRYTFDFHLRVEKPSIFLLYETLWKIFHPPSRLKTKVSWLILAFFPFSLFSS